jgi:uroporphyrinogen decarboxylase
VRDVYGVVRDRTLDADVGFATNQVLPEPTVVGLDLPDPLDAVADFNIAQVREALQYDIDAVYCGDDWGQQSGLLMGRPLWDAFIRPRVARMYAAAHDAGTFVMNHSCGDVDALVPAYPGRLALLGGLSTQKTLPYGTPDDVRRESRPRVGLKSRGACT